MERFWAIKDNRGRLLKRGVLPRLYLSTETAQKFADLLTRVGDRNAPFQVVEVAIVEVK